MLRMTRVLALVLVGALVVMVTMASPAEASSRRGGPGMEFGAYVFRGNFDNESNIENDEGLGARFGILFQPEHEMEFSVDKVSTQDDLGLGLDVDLTTFKIGYVYNFNPSTPVVPFVTVGGGWQRVKISDPTLFGSSVLTDETDPMAFAGGGVRFYIGPVFNIRVDGGVQAVIPDSDLDNTLFDGVLSAGVGWTIGGR